MLEDTCPLKYNRLIIHCRYLCFKRASVIFGRHGEFAMQSSGPSLGCISRISRIHCLCTVVLTTPCLTGALHAYLLSLSILTCLQSCRKFIHLLFFPSPKSHSTIQQPNMTQSSILMTGASSFIGFACLVQALQNGHQVRCAVRSQSKKDLI